MQGLILAGGNGTRIAKDIHYTSKVLLPIADRTLIQRNVDSLAPYVSEVFIVVGDAKDDIIQEIESRKQLVPIIYIDKEDAKNPLEGMRKALPFMDDNILMALGDEILISGHIGGLADNAHERKSDMSLAMIPDSDEKDIAQCYSFYYDSERYITKMVEKPTEFPNKDRGAGYYYISKQVFKLLESDYFDGRKDILDLFNYAISRGFKATSYHVAYQAYNINTLDELNRVKEYFK